MVIDSNAIELTAAQRRLVADQAGRQCRAPDEVFWELLGPTDVRQRNGRRRVPPERAHDVGCRLGLFAALENGPADLSTNPYCMME